MRALLVLYDERCALCVRCRDWLARQKSLVPLFFLASGSAEARHRFGAVPWLGEELVVVSDDGDAWIGPAAFLVALWALEAYRLWSYRLSGPAFAPLAERFFHAISSNRRAIAALLAPDPCEDGACRLPRSHARRMTYR